MERWRLSVSEADPGQEDSTSETEAVEGDTREAGPLTAVWGALGTH